YRAARSFLSFSLLYILPLVSLPFFFALLIRRPPRSPLFPYTTLFRSTIACIVSMIPVASSSLCKKKVPLHDLPSAIPSMPTIQADRKSTRLNSSHVKISYAVFCLKKKKKTNLQHITTNILHMLNDQIK